MPSRGGQGKGARTEEELAYRRALGRRLRRLRREREINQDDLADRAGIGRSHVGWIETARTEPLVVTLVRLAKALEVEPWELLKLEDVDLEEPDSSAA